MPELKKSLGWRYLQDSKFDRESLSIMNRPHIGPAPICKTYPDAEKISLPRDLNDEERNLWSQLQNRRSRRSYTDRSLSLQDIALLLWATQGITARAGNFALRTAPSAGALYPIETYLAANRIEGLEPGLFHYDVPGFQLERLSDTPPDQEVAAAALDQAFVGKAAAVFLWSAEFRRNMTKYGHRGARYICMDAGHICQNLLLAAEAMGLAACPVAAFYDDELNTLLGLDGDEESVLYLAAVGVKS